MNARKLSLAIFKLTKFRERRTVALWCQLLFYANLKLQLYLILTVARSQTAVRFLYLDRFF